LKTRL